MDSLTTGDERLEVGSGQANLLVENQMGKTHGIEINGSRTRITGGQNSTALTLDDNGATFGNATTGAPIQVHGVLDGTSEFDAVNFRQLDKVNKGVAMSMAMDGIPQAFNGKGSIGLGIGRFNGQNALAISASYHDDDGVLTYSVKAAQAGSGNNAGSVGVGWAF